MYRLEKQLLQLEIKHGIIVRWDKNDPQFTAAKQDHLKGKKEQLQTSIWATISKRQYLLKMKAKFAGIIIIRVFYVNNIYTLSIHIDGQKIAKKLCKGIAKETNKLLEEYNAISSQIESCFRSLSLEEILSPAHINVSLGASSITKQPCQVPANMQ